MMPSRPRQRHGATLALTSLLLPLLCRAIHLDVHVPLPQGCLKYHALLANRLLREASEALAPPPNNTGDEEGGEVPRPSEGVDLFARHAAHVTLYLADFDLEADDDEAKGGANNIDLSGTDSETADDAGADNAARALNQTKVQDFMDVIGSLNFTELLAGWNCPLSFAQDVSTSRYYKINGAYAMLPILDTPCLQTLSTALLHSLQSYLKQPVAVPSWVTSLVEPERSAAIYRSEMYGSPNVLEGFDPHVTVGFDDGTSTSEVASAMTLQWRSDAMKESNDAYEVVHETCLDEVQDVALGKTGVGGTVLADSIMGHWNLFDKTEGRRNGLTRANLYAVVD